MEDISNNKTVYHPRRPYDSPLWRLLDNHYENFERCYEERFEQKYGFFRPVIREVGGSAITILNIDSPVSQDCLQEIKKLDHVEEVYQVNL